jgi:hypothetical protein
VAADGGVAEGAHGLAAFVGLVAVWDVGREMQGVAFAQLLFASLRAERERPVEADHEFLGAGGVGVAGVDPRRVQAHLEDLEPAVAAVDVDQAAVDAGFERVPLAVAAANQMAGDRVVLGERVQPRATNHKANDTPMAQLRAAASRVPRDARNRR